MKCQKLKLKTYQESSSSFSLLENVQKNHAPGIAIGGKPECRFIYTNTLNATVKVVEDINGKHFNNNTFEILSSYWTKDSLQEFIS